MRIAVIGSMKFYPEFVQLKNTLEERGNKVTVPLRDEHYRRSLNVKLEAMKVFNKDLEKADAVLVANYTKNNIENYVGINTIMEIGMAFNKGKKIFILNNIPVNMKDELVAIKAIVLNGDLNKIK